MNATLEQALTDVCKRFLGDIHLVQEFLREIGSFLVEKQKKAKPKQKQFGKRDVQELKKLIAFFDSFIRKGPPKWNKGKSLTLHSEPLGKLVMGLAIPIKHKGLLAEMTLTHLISQEEGFLKEYIFNLLVFRKELLKSNKQLTYSEVCESDSLDTLLRRMARRETDALGHGSIDDFAKYIKERLGTDVTLFPEWNRIRESSYRRNLLAHNGGVTNDTYCVKVGFKKRGIRLSTKTRYTSRVAAVISHFIEYTDSQLRRKFKIKRRTKPNKRVHRIAQRSVSR